jgi:phospholipid/cholesterol/gamma-HCH transport system substrate-binding protein
MKNTLETRLGLFVALVMLAAFFLLAIIGGFEKFRRGLHIHAYFKSVQELKVGDRVKMAGVEVGKVEDIQITNNLVKVSMKLRANTPVKTDSIAAIKFAGLMGQSFVSLNFGSPDNNQRLRRRHDRHTDKCHNWRRLAAFRRDDPRGRFDERG